MKPQSSLAQTLPDSVLEPLLVAWKKGIEDFNESRYWHAHEDWEQDWVRLPSPYKPHIQSLIMGCAVLIHLENGRLGPASAVGRRCLEIWDLGEGTYRPQILIAGFKELIQDFMIGSAASVILERAKSLHAELLT